MPKLASAVTAKSDEDLIVFLDKKYYYLKAADFKKYGQVVDPETDIEAAEANDLRVRGTYLAHMDTPEGGGYWTTLINLDATIAGIHQTLPSKEANKLRNKRKRKASKT